MNEWKIYHNPRCSKSRETLALLEEAGIQPQVVEYLRHPPTEAELLELMDRIPGAPASLVRTKEEKYRELSFPLDDKAAVARHLSRYPELLERPVVVKGNAAVLGRPPENIKKLL
jgi:arsenate reductase (glutaredoxin)